MLPGRGFQLQPVELRSPQLCENAVEAVLSAPHSCLTTLSPTPCSPAHANVSYMDAPAQYRAQYTLTNYIYGNQITYVVVQTFYSQKLDD